MLLASFVALFITIIYTAINYKSKLTYVVGSYIFSIVTMMLAVVMYTTKFSTYEFPLKLDYGIYLFLSNNFKLTIGVVSRILNFSFSLFLLSTVAYVKIFSGMKWYKALFFVVPVICFCFLNDPIVSKKIFFLTNSLDEGTVNFYTRIQNFISSYNIAIFWAYAIFPVYYIVKQYYELKLSREKRDLFLSIFIILLVYVCVYSIFIWGPYKFVMMNNVNFMKIPESVPNDVSYALMPMIILLILIIVLVILLHNKPFYNYSIINNWEFINNSKWLDKNVNMILHIYKNAFWGINQYLKFAEDNINDTEKTRENISKSRAIAERHIEMLINMQSKLDYVKGKFVPIKLDDCINQALAKVGLPAKNISVVYEDYNRDITISGNFEHLCEAFVNLFLNAVQAINRTKKEKAKISISAKVDKRYIIITITDNGCGIHSNDIKEVFKPFFSTEHRNNSGGIGLYYVDNVIKHHFGEISVKSKVNEYTKFQIVLPAKKKGMEG